MNQSRVYRRAHCQDIPSLRTRTHAYTNTHSLTSPSRTRTWSTIGPTYSGFSGAWCQVSLYVCVACFQLKSFKRGKVEMLHWYYKILCNLRWDFSKYHGFDLCAWDCIPVLCISHVCFPMSGTVKLTSLDRWGCWIGCGIVGVYPCSNFHPSTCILWNERRCYQKYIGSS